jgi:hypothetical protein
MDLDITNEYDSFGGVVKMTATLPKNSFLKPIGAYTEQPYGENDAKTMFTLDLEVVCAKKDGDVISKESLRLNGTTFSQFFADKLQEDYAQDTFKDVSGRTIEFSVRSKESSDRVNCAWQFADTVQDTPLNEQEAEQLASLMV